MVHCNMIQSIHDLEAIKDTYLQKQSTYRYQILVCSGAGCISSNCYEVKEAIREELKLNELEEEVVIYETGCMGTCAVGPVMMILPDRVFYTNLTADNARTIVKSHIVNGEIILKHTFYDHSLHKYIPKLDDIDFFKEQVKIALRNCGEMDYRSLEAYIAREGYFAIAKVLSEKSRMEVINEVRKSGLKGRGGGRLPYGSKMGSWISCRR